MRKVLSKKADEINTPEPIHTWRNWLVGLLAIAAFILFMTALLSCSTEDVQPSKVPQQLKPCETVNTLPPGAERHFEITTSVCVDNFIVVIQQGSKGYYVTHTCRLSELSVPLAEGDYKIGLLLCGQGSTSEEYTLVVEGAEYSQRVGYLVDVTF